MSSYLKFADGSTEPGEAGYATGQLWLYFRNKTLVEVINMMLESDLSEITFYYGNEHVSYVGFTMMAIMQDGNEIKVRLSGGSVAEEDESDERALAGNGSDEFSSDRGSES